jgi:Nitrate and nitrite sensing
MSGTALDHRLVREYLRELDTAMRGLPAAQARELTEQITAHLEDALGPDAGDQEIAAILNRLGSPAGLAAEAGAGAGAEATAGTASGSSAPRCAPGGSRMRWRLASVIAVPTVIVAILGALQISSDVSNDVASGRVQHLALLNTAAVKLTQDLEDERDLSAAYAARRQPGPVPVTLANARTVTDAAVSTVRADATGVGAGYEPGTVQALHGLLASLADLGSIRAAVSSPTVPVSEVIRVYTGNLIGPADTFSAAVSYATGNTHWQDTVTTLTALLRVENDQSMQRAILYAALSAQPPVLPRENLSLLQQAAAQETGDLTTFNASAGPAEQQLFDNTVSGAAVDSAATQEILAESAAVSSPRAPLTRNAGLDAMTWYGDMSTTIGDTRQVVGQLTGQITGQANALKSSATKSLLLTSIVTLVLLLMLLTSAVLARPRRKQHEQAA